MNIEEHEAEWAKKRDAKDPKRENQWLGVLTLLLFICGWAWGAFLVNQLAKIFDSSGAGIALLHVLACGAAGIIAFAYYATKAGGGR